MGDGLFLTDAVHLTFHTDYALRVLIYLMRHPGERATTREMAEFYGVSHHHLIKVAKTLTRAGWLVATRGAGGGLTLAAHTPDARVGEIVRFTESGDLVECFAPATNTCPIAETCALQPLLYRARRAFFEVLDGHTVRDLAGQTDPAA